MFEFSSKIYPGSAYIEIFCDRNAVFYDFTTKIVYLCFYATKMPCFKFHECSLFITDIIANKIQMRYKSKNLLIEAHLYRSTTKKIICNCFQVHKRPKLINIRHKKISLKYRDIF